MLKAGMAPIVEVLALILIVCSKLGGAEGDRTPGLGIANAALSHLSYSPFEQKQ